MFEDVKFILGQILGIIAVVLGFISYQMKTPAKLLALKVVTSVCFSAHYLIIGALTAVPLNFIGAVECVCYYFRNKNESKSPVMPVLFSLLMIVFGIMTWEGWYSALILTGLVVNAVALSFYDTQKIRMSEYIRSPLCMIYNIIVSSGGGIIYECAMLVSCTTALWKNRKTNFEINR